MYINVDENSSEDAADASLESSQRESEGCCLTVTHIPDNVFVEADSKECFERAFRQYGEITVIYLKSFRRARVIYENEESAILAKTNLHGCLFQDNELGVYFTQVPQCQESSSLQLPPPVKQFLISPPASPPVDWEPIPEATPVINHDFVAAVARLQVNEPYEAHPSSGTHGHPSIKVHWCTDEDTENDTKKEHPLLSLPRHLVQTRKPDTKPTDKT